MKRLLIILFALIALFTACNVAETVPAEPPEFLEEPIIITPEPEEIEEPELPSWWFDPSPRDGEPSWVSAYRQHVFELYFGDTPHEQFVETWSFVYLHDINDDGIPELFIPVGALDSGFLVYGYFDGEVAELGDLYGAIFISLAGHNGIFAYSHHYGWGGSRYFELINGKLTVTENDINFLVRYELADETVLSYFIHGEEVSEEIYYEILAEYFTPENEILTYDSHVSMQDF